MSKTVVIALPYFEGIAQRIANSVDATFIPYSETAFEDAFAKGHHVVAIMATGIVVRKIAPLLRDKWCDSAVVVVSPDQKFAIPITGGHHGANELAYTLAERCGLTPVITTATESTGRPSAEKIAANHSLRIVNTDSTRISNAAVLTGTSGIFTVEGPGMVIARKGVTFLVSDAPYTAGIGCRKGASAGEITDAIHHALKSVHLETTDISIFATSTLKLHEEGLTSAIREIGGNLIYLDHETLCQEEPPSTSAAGRFGLPGVAEPAALAVSYKKELIMEKQVYGNVTIAIAR